MFANQAPNTNQPFCVVGSDFESDGRIKTRKYPWGTVDIEDENQRIRRIERGNILD